MLQHKAYKFQIKPNKEQKKLIHKTIGCCRFVFNHFLALWNKIYDETKKGLTYNLCSGMLPSMKKDKSTSWLKEVDMFHFNLH